MLTRLAFNVGLIVVIKGQTTLPWWSYIVALVLGTLVTVRQFYKDSYLDLNLKLCPQPFSTLLVARLGNGIATNQLMKMVAGAINPGKPVANLYVSHPDHELPISFIY